MVAIWVVGVGGVQACSFRFDGGLFNYADQGGAVSIPRSDDRGVAFRVPAVSCASGDELAVSDCPTMDGVALRPVVGEDSASFFYGASNAADVRDDV